MKKNSILVLFILIICVQVKYLITQNRARNNASKVSNTKVERSIASIKIDKKKLINIGYKLKAHKSDSFSRESKIKKNFFEIESRIVKKHLNQNKKMTKQFPIKEYFAVNKEDYETFLGEIILQKGNFYILKKSNFYPLGVNINLFEVWSDVESEQLILFDGLIKVDAKNNKDFFNLISMYQNELVNSFENLNLIFFKVEVSQTKDFMALLQTNFKDISANYEFISRFQESK